MAEIDLTRLLVRRQSIIGSVLRSRSVAEKAEIIRRGKTLDVNYGLTVWLVHGGFGVAPLGLFGAGLATTIVSWFMFLALALHVYRKPMFRGYGVFKEKWHIYWPLCREILWLGLPIAGLAFLEAGLFVATSILSGVIGAKTLAAYEITAAWVGIPFVIAFGLAEATMIRSPSSPSVDRQYKGNENFPDHQA